LESLTQRAVNRVEQLESIGLSSEGSAMGETREIGGGFRIDEIGGSPILSILLGNRISRRDRCLEPVGQQCDVAGRQPYLVSRMDLGRFLDSSVVDPSAVARVEILDPEVAPFAVETSMQAREKCIRDYEIGIGGATDGDRIVSQGKLEIVPLARKHLQAIHREFRPSPYE